MPAHLDFLRHGLSLHTLACETALLMDNAARLIGVSVAESITLTVQLLERFQCLLS